MEHSPGQIISWATDQAPITLRKLKLYQASYLTTTLWDWKSITGEETEKKHTNTWRLNNS